MRQRPSGLRIPPGRQGPGPMPERIVGGLERVMATPAGRAVPGDKRAAGVGAGTELALLRPSEGGDDGRQIAPPATARAGEPYVRVHVPERTLTTWVAVDVSPSMAFGTAMRLKSDVAEGAALVVGRLAIRRAGRVAVMKFGAGKPELHPPRASKPGLVALRRALGEGVARDGQGDRHALADALRRLGRVAIQPGLVAIISD